MPQPTKLQAMVLKTTILWTENQYEARPTLSGVKQEIVDLVAPKKNNFSSLDKDLCSLQNKIPRDYLNPRKRLSFETFLAIVPTKRDDDKSEATFNVGGYAYDQCVVYMNNDPSTFHFKKADGTVGSQMPTSRKDIRPASPSEIKAYFEKKALLAG